MTSILLNVKNLTTNFHTENGTFSAVKNFNLSIEKGQTICVVGESGSGKSVTSLSIMKLLPRNGETVSGEVLLNNKDILRLSKKEMLDIRGKSISMIFQDPMSSLDPVFTCGSQIVETIRIHKKISKEEASKKAIALLEQVKIPNPQIVYSSYPHELSGGMCQRVMIAMALSCDPELLIADEPTTALDVTVQAEILTLLKEIKENMGMSILLITHDLGVVAKMADQVVVMYSGQIVEKGDARSIFYNSRHPYTEGLIKSMPKLEQTNKRLYSINGSVPGIDSMPKGCPFHPRCPLATDICRQQEPVLEAIDTERSVRCWHANKEVRRCLTTNY